MSLLLAVESSSNEYRVVLGRDGEAIFDSVVNKCDLPFRTLGALLECGLEAVGARANEINGVAINVGPGSLTFVRAGISYVNAYAGLIRGASVEIMRFGRVDEALAKVSGGLSEVAVAGRIRHRLAALLGEARVVDTGIENPDAHTLLKMGYEAWRAGDRSTKQVEALNDQSDVFFE